jgi:hypothetical protein
MDLIRSRLFLLIIVAIVMGGYALWRWLDGRGTVTVNFVDAPLGRVAASVGRQTGLDIVTNADLEQKITLQLRRAPVFDALETLATRIDGSLRLAYLMAPDKAALASGIALLTVSEDASGWRVTSPGWGGGWSVGETVPDLRRVAFRPSPQENPALSAWLEQLSQKSGATFLRPEGWDPSLPKPPPAARVGHAAKKTAKAAGGIAGEIVWIPVRTEGPRGPRATAPSETPASRGQGAGRRGFGGNQQNNPEWVAERIEAQIALLPPEEREQVRTEFVKMREFWAEVRALPEDQRRAKMEDFFSNPEVQARMEERTMRRDMRRSPEQRAERYKRYVQRKMEAISQ